MLIGYARVSTVDQNLALQRDALTEDRRSLQLRPDRAESVRSWDCCQKFANDCPNLLLTLIWLRKPPTGRNLSRRRLLDRGTTGGQRLWLPLLSEPVAHT